VWAYDEAVNRFEIQRAKEIADQASKNELVFDINDLAEDTDGSFALPQACGSLVSQDMSSDSDSTDDAPLAPLKTQNIANGTARAITTTPPQRCPPSITTTPPQHCPPSPATQSPLLAEIIKLASQLEAQKNTEIKELKRQLEAQKTAETALKAQHECAMDHQKMEHKNVVDSLFLALDEHKKVIATKDHQILNEKKKRKATCVSDPPSLKKVPLNAPLPPIRSGHLFSDLRRRLSPARRHSAHNPPSHSDPPLLPPPPPIKPKCDYLGVVKRALEDCGTDSLTARAIYGHVMSVVVVS
jgi:hypothetical protein